MLFLTPFCPSPISLSLFFFSCLSFFHIPTAHFHIPDCAVLLWDLLEIGVSSNFAIIASLLAALMIFFSALWGIPEYKINTVYRKKMSFLSPRISVFPICSATIKSSTGIKPLLTLYSSCRYS